VTWLRNDGLKASSVRLQSLLASFLKFHFKVLMQMLLCLNLVCPSQTSYCCCHPVM